ncbi:MAG: hypothetical protein ABS36_15020 [Acidobacteria bacterium SCN 69-37]|nr:MAG: hypothetical protein ABS36_15020 [Acidobacteria bacterium SCN 69-37]
MYTEILRSIDGIGIFPIISLVVFVAVFAVVLIWAARADRGRLARHATLPFSEAAPLPSDPADRDTQGRRA